MQYGLFSCDETVFAVALRMSFILRLLQAARSAERQIEHMFGAFCQVEF